MLVLDATEYDSVDFINELEVGTIRLNETSSWAMLSEASPSSEACVKPELTTSLSL